MQAVIFTGLVPVGDHTPSWLVYCLGMASNLDEKLIFHGYEIDRDPLYPAEYGYCIWRNKFKDEYGHKWEIRGDWVPANRDKNDPACDPATPWMVSTYLVGSYPEFRLYGWGATWEDAIDDLAQKARPLLEALRDLV